MQCQGCLGPSPACPAPSWLPCPHHRYFPFGIVFLIAGKILEMDDPTAVGQKLGFYAVTVVCGLVVHGLLILPLLYFSITRKNPLVFIRGVLQALLIALATSSRSERVPSTPPTCPAIICPWPQAQRSASQACSPPWGGGVAMVTRPIFEMSCLRSQLPEWQKALVTS